MKELIETTTLGVFSTFIKRLRFKGLKPANFHTARTALYAQTFLVVIIGATFGIRKMFGYKNASAPLKASTYHDLKVGVQSQTPPQEGDVVFFGDSETDNFDPAEFLRKEGYAPKGGLVTNKGISGDNALGLFERINPGKARHVFIQIGINDLCDNTAPDTLLERVKKVIWKSKKVNPAENLFMIGIFPTGWSNPKFAKIGKIIPIYNKKLELYCKNSGVATFLSANAALSDKTGSLKPEFTCPDCLHMTGPAYTTLVHEVIYPALMNAELKKNTMLASN